MNVKELKENIKNLPDDMEIILQKDSEGDRFSPLCGSDKTWMYVSDSSYSGDMYNDTWFAEDFGIEEKEWEELKLKSRVLVLFPIN